MALEGMPHADMAVAITLGRYPTHHNSVRHSNIIPSTVKCCLFHKRHQGWQGSLLGMLHRTGPEAGCIERESGGMGEKEERERRHSSDLIA